MSVAMAIIDIILGLTLIPVVRAFDKQGKIEAIALIIIFAVNALLLLMK